MHEFLIPSENARHEPIDLVIDLREYIESLPKTSATFRSKNVGEAAHGISTRRGIQSEPDPYGWTDGDKIAWLVGTWRVPDWYHGNGGHKSYTSLHVNPRATPGTRAMYADALVQCKCGEMIAKLPSERRRDGSGNFYTAVAEHGDCTSGDRERAREKLWERREAIIATGYRLGLPCELIESRCGCVGTAARGSISKHTTDKLGLARPKDTREDAYIEMGETYLVLNRIYDTPSEAVAKAYGVSPGGLRHYARLAREAHGDEATLLDRFTSREDRDYEIHFNVPEARAGGD